MKRFIALMLAGVMTVSMLASCSKEDTADTTETSEESTTAEAVIPDKLGVVVDGKSDYVIVVDYTDEGAKAFATVLLNAIRTETGVYLSIKDASRAEPSYVHEIAIGSAREYSAQIESALEGEDFIFTTSGENIVFCATSDDMYDYLSLIVSDEILFRAKQGSYSINSDTRFLYSESEYADTSYVTLYREIYGTYGSYYQEWFATHMPAAVVADQNLCVALIERMGGSMAVMADKSFALYKGKIVQLDDDDYTKTATVNASGDVLIPKAFADEYFGKSMSDNGAGMVNISDYVASTADYSIYYDSTNRMAVISPSSVKSFANASDKIGGYSNTQYLNRMVQFFKSFIVPDTNAELTRILVEDTSSSYDPSTATDYKKVSRNTTLSPSFLAVTEGSDTVLYASYEYWSMIDFCKGQGCATYVKKSTDGGKTWQKIAQFDSMSFAELFEVNGNVYLLGNKGGKAHLAKISRTGSVQTSDLGISWPTVKLFGGTEPMRANPTNMLIHNGRLYHACDDFVMSVDINTDLMVGTNWTVSNSLRNILTNNWYASEIGSSGSAGEWSWMEGNVIYNPNDDTIYLLYRFNGISAGQNERAVLMKVTEDGSTVSFVDLVHIPTTRNKFTVHYDATSGMFMMLTSEYRADTLITSNERGNVVLLVSSDLVNWSKAADIISDRNMMNESYLTMVSGWQYIDWQIVGDDIMMLVREADEMGCSYHDGTYAAFYVIEDFRALLPQQ